VTTLFFASVGQALAGRGRFVSFGCCLKLRPEWFTVKVLALYRCKRQRLAKWVIPAIQPTWSAEFVYHMFMRP
jgi:hypothetical protein